MTDSILIIEDEPSLREELVSAFRQAGFTVAYVADYPEALPRLNEFKPDLIIMDIALPTSDGFDACSELRSTSGIPVVLLDEDSSDEAWARVMEADADLYEIKPCRHVLELVAKVKAILRRYRLTASRSGAPGYEKNRRQDSCDYLTSEDRTDGFSIVADDCNNITLLRWGKPVARFSAVVTEEVLRGFLKLVKDSERSDNKQAGTK